MTFFAYCNNLQPVDRLEIFVFCQYYFIFCLFLVLSWNSLSYFPFFIWFLSHHSSMSNFQVHLNFLEQFSGLLRICRLSNRVIVNKNNVSVLRITCIFLVLISSTGFTYLEKQRVKLMERYLKIFFIASKKLKICTTRKNNKVFKKLKIS